MLWKIYRQNVASRPCSPNRARQGAGSPRGSATPLSFGPEVDHRRQSDATFLANHGSIYHAFYAPSYTRTTNTRVATPVHWPLLKARCFGCFYYSHLVPRCLQFTVVVNIVVPGARTNQTSGIFFFFLRTHQCIRRLKSLKTLCCCACEHVQDLKILPVHVIPQAKYCRS